LGLTHPEGLPTIAEFLGPEGTFPGPEHGLILRRHAVDALGKFGD
jgi:hypothetical protein